MMEPRIVQLNQLILVGRPYFGDSADNKFGQAWDRFFPYEKAISNRTNEKVFYGVEDYGPEFEQTHQWMYFPSTQVSSLDEIPTGLFGRTLPAATYAVFTAKGGIPKLHDTFMYAYMTWLPASEYESAYPFDFEYYDERFKDQDPNSEIDIFIPVKPKTG
jgi:AraC family transcriptional regulator